MKTNKNRKRLCSALLCLILTVSMLPITGYAGEGEIEATGGSAVQYPIEINEDNFPDAAFRAYITKFDTDKNNSLSQKEIESVTEIDVSSDTYGVAQKISSLQGIKYFTNLEELSCSNHDLSELDVSALKKLKRLYCSNNPKICSLDVSQNTKLETLSCSCRDMGMLFGEEVKGSLSELTFGTDNATLNSLDCINNSLQGLDLRHLTGLQTLHCGDNALTLLDTSKNSKLKYLHVENNELKSLGLSANIGLTELLCYGNQLWELDLSNFSELAILWCYDNNLTSLKVNNCTKLGQLRCDNNTLTSLDIRNTALNQSTYSGALQCEENFYKIQIDGDRTFDLTTLPGNFDARKALKITGGIIKGNILTVDENATKVTYTYDCGATSETISNPTFTLLVEKEQTYAINVENDGNGTASASVASAAQGEQVTLTAEPSDGYEFKAWEIVSGNITINDNKFTMPASEVTVKASFKKKVASGGSSGGGAYVPSTPPAPSNPKPSGSAVTSDVSGSTSRKDGETSTKVDQSTADKLVDAAIDNKSTDIVIDTASKTENGGVPNVKASEVTLPTETIKNIAEKTDASLTIKTDVGEIKLDNKAAASVSKQGENIGAPGEQETISIIAKKVKEDTEEVRYELEIKNSGGKTISDFRGGTATITVPVPSGLQGESLICVYINKKGHYNKVKGKWTADGRYAFSTGHFSTYAMMREITADTVIAKQKAAVRKMTMEVRTKIVKTKSGKQAIRVTWTSGGKIIPDGVQIYRSTKKGGSFGKKPIFTTEKTRYLNTAVKTGQRYYYKVRGYVTIDGETVYSKLSGKGNRKLPETV